MPSWPTVSRCRGCGRPGHSSSRSFCQPRISFSSSSANGITLSLRPLPKTLISRRLKSMSVSVSAVAAEIMNEGAHRLSLAAHCRGLLAFARDMRHPAAYVRGGHVVEAYVCRLSGCSKHGALSSVMPGAFVSGAFGTDGIAASQKGTEFPDIADVGRHRMSGAVFLIAEISFEIIYAFNLRHGGRIRHRIIRIRHDKTV